MSTNETPPSDTDGGSSSRNATKYTGPAATNGRGKGRGIPWPEKNAIAFKRRNIQSMWNQQAALVERRASDCVLDADEARAKLVPGALLSTAHHTSCSDTDSPLWLKNAPATDTIPWDDPYRTATPFGVVYSKYRKFVVVWVHDEHLTCLPIYTHKGKGIDKRRQEEHMGLRDVRLESPPTTASPAEAGAVHGCVAAEMTGIQSVERDGKVVVRPPPPLSATASIHLTQFVTIWKDDLLTYEGCLISGDAERLKKAVLSLL